MAYRNAFDLVLQTHQDYPSLVHDDPGRFVDQVAHRLNRVDGEIRWGRKRKNDGSLNLDALAYLNVPGDAAKKTLVDVIVAKGTPQSQPSWQEYPGDNALNGTWAPPQADDLDPGQPAPEAEPAPAPGPPPAPTPSLDTDRIIEALNNGLTQVVLAINQVNATLTGMRQGVEQAVPDLPGIVGAVRTLLGLPGLPGPKKGAKK